MVEVRFAFIDSIEGVKCVLDGVTKYSDAGGFCSFFGISQGAHTYSISKEGYNFIEGQDPFGRPLDESGTTTIEWAPDPIVPWPETQSWLMLITLEAISMEEFRFDSWNPPLDTREVFIVGAAWPEVIKVADIAEDIYAHYVVKNIGGSAGEATVMVKDLDTDLAITTWSIPELAPNERFKTSSSGAYIGKMPARNWRLEFKVEP